MLFPGLLFGSTTFDGKSLDKQDEHATAVMIALRSHALAIRTVIASRHGDLSNTRLNGIVSSPLQATLMSKRAFSLVLSEQHIFPGLCASILLFVNHTSPLNNQHTSSTTLASAQTTAIPNRSSGGGDKHAMSSPDASRIQSTQMVKLNIEMSMADMIIKVARSNEQDMNFGSSPEGTPYPRTLNTQKSQHNHTFHEGECHGVPKNVTNTAFVGHNRSNEDLREDIRGIKRQTEVQVYVGDSDSENRSIDLEHGKRTTRDFTRDRDGFAINPRASRHSNDSQIPMNDLTSPVGCKT